MSFRTSSCSCYRYVATCTVKQDTHDSLLNTDAQEYSKMSRTEADGNYSRCSAVFLLRVIFSYKYFPIPLNNPLIQASKAELCLKGSFRPHFQLFKWKHSSGTSMCQTDSRTCLCEIALQFTTVVNILSYFFMKY